MSADLDRVRNIRQTVAGDHCRDPGFHRKPSGFAELLIGDADLTDTERPSGVTVPSVEDRATVDGNQVAFSQDVLS